MKKNILWIVKMTAIYSFWGIILQAAIVNLLFASSPSEGQNLRDVKLSVKAINVTFNEALKIIEQKTDFKFNYIEDEIPINENVTISVTDESLYNILEVFANDYGLIFNRINNQITIKKGESAEVIEKNSAQETGSIKGKVTDAKTGEPLIGANVMLKGTAIGTATNANGYYLFENILAGEQTVVVKYVGYGTKEEEVTVAANKTVELNFLLIPSLVNLDEITVTGTLSAREIRSYPATIAELKGVELQNRNLNNLANVLEAIPGIIVQPGNEQYNTGARSRVPFGILIRGTSAGAKIKYLVDGIDIVVEGNESILQTIDPNDIEKIEVLKGPMASTLYGSGAAGGIISITTKKGKEGKTKINFRTMFTQYANDYADYSGYNQNYSLNLSGGSEQFNYLLGVGYNLYPTTKLSDINDGIDDKTWSYTARIHGKLSNLSADLSLHYGSKNSGSSSSDISYNKYRASLGLSQLPVSPLSDYRIAEKDFLTSLHLTHSLADNWYHDLTVGYNITNFNNSYYTKDYAGNYSNYEVLWSKMNVRYFMYYEQKWSGQLKSSLTAGFEYNGYEIRNMFLGSTTPPKDFFRSSTPATEGSANFTRSPFSSTGYFAEAVTGLNNNLFLTTGIRIDVNPAYGDNVDSYAQPRVGLSYVIETGEFNIKPRVAWGVSSTPPNPTYKITTIVTSPYFTSVTTGNPDIKPQRSEGYELGADIFYGSNYLLNVTYYDQKIKDMIQSSFSQDLTTNPRTDYYYYYNVAEAINKGIEISAKAVIKPLELDISYTETVSKWSDKIGQTPSATVYPGAPNLNIPKRSIYARISYTIPSVLPWSEKGGKVSLDWRYNGSSYFYDSISFLLAIDAYKNAPEPKPAFPNLNNYLIWQKGYSYFNLRADYSVTDYASLYVDIQNLLDKQGSLNGQTVEPFPGRRINFGFTLTY